MSQAVAIGTRLELLLDRHLIESLDNAKLQLNHPVRKEIALPMDSPWEGIGSGVYSCVFRDGGKIRMYYRATSGLLSDEDETQYCCYAESEDGIRWARPDLGIALQDLFPGNNIVMAGHLSHDFSPFLDTNPDCPLNQRYKAIAGNWNEGLFGFVSADGLHWELIQEEPLITDGNFDSHNLAFWDEGKRRYICYSRYFRKQSPGEAEFTGVRCIQSSESADFLHWGPQRPNVYDEAAPLEHFYTNATMLCPGAEHVYLSFPMRFMPERNKIKDFPKVGVSDNVILSSRDGLHWDREFLEAWAKPGRNPRNWTERSHIVARGIIDTSPEEFSFYSCEHYEWDETHIRRLTIPRHRFASVGAGYNGGSFVTKPVVFEGERLVLNYATSAAGSVSLQLEDEVGQPINGFTFADCEVLYGDELDHAVVWGEARTLAKLAGTPVRIRFMLKDADIYAFRFATE